MEQQRQSERQKVLQMLEDGKISATDAARLINALNEIDEPISEEWADTVQVTPQPTMQPHEAEKFRHFWQIPFYIALSLTVLLSAGLYMYGSSGGESWLAYFCFGNMLLFSIIAALLALATRFSLWLHLRVEETDGTKVAISLPLFMPLITFGLSIARGRVNEETSRNIETAEAVIRAFSESGNRAEPLMLHVDDDDGDKVQIYIG
jgi:hypothetical protein